MVRRWLFTLFKLFKRNQPFVLPQAVQKICANLHDHGFQAYVVGGAVRDFLRGYPAHDWDIATDALPDQVESLFTHTVPTGKGFGTITVITESMSVEVTTLRQDGRYTDSRHPDDVSYTKDVIADLSRRDFTINAIAYHPLTRKFIDPFGGIRDIERKKLTTVGQPLTRFQEDPLRMIRLFRFTATLQFEPTTETISGLNPPLLSSVSWERIRDEFSKLLLAEKLAPTFVLLHRTKILDQILPELTHTVGVQQGNNHRWDVFGHSVMTAEAIKPVLELRLAALLHDVGKAQTYTHDEQGIHFHNHAELGAQISHRILTRFRYSNQIIEDVCSLVRWHMFPIHPNSTDKAIRRFITQVGADRIFDLLELRRADIVAMRFQPREALYFGQTLHKRIQAVLEQSNALNIKDLAINGHTLIKALGFIPGPPIGAVLQHLFDLVIDDPELNQEDRLLSLAKEWQKAHR